LIVKLRNKIEQRNTIERETDRTEKQGSREIDRTEKQGSRETDRTEKQGVDSHP